MDKQKSSDLLCWFGGDIYTEEGTKVSLNNTLNKAQKNIVRFDIQQDKWILFSDQHRGAKTGADDFARCEANYLTALDHYFEKGFNLCVMGDAEELWEEFPHKVIRNNSASFKSESRFHEAGRYMRIRGNHDEIWGNSIKVQNLLQSQYGERPLNVPESVLLDAMDGNKKLGSILLIHGYQGTQNERGDMSVLAKFVLHYFWRPFQILTHISINTPATSWKLRDERDKIIYQWVTTQPGLILIAGHTHRPVFESYTHRARLIMQLSAARSQMGLLTGDRQKEEAQRIEQLSFTLQKLESKLSEEERSAPQPIENPLPCYFNTGCCSFSDGDITGIEIANGEIRLVRWPDDNDRHQPKILQSGNLGDIFKAINK